MKMSRTVKYYENIMKCVENAIKRSEKCQIINKVADNYVMSKNGKLDRIFEYTVNFIDEDNVEYCLDVFIKAEDCQNDDFESILCHIVLDEDFENIVETPFFSKAYSKMCRILEVPII